MGDVPTATSLRDVYTDDAIAVQEKRWESLLAKFKEQFSSAADFVSRSPGRVNVIGEVRLAASRKRKKRPAL